MKRHGFTIVEISATIALLAVCMVLFAQLAALTSSERVSERTRKIAVDQIQNILERLAAIPPEKLAAGEFDNSIFDKKAAEELIERSLPEGKIVFDTKKVEPDSVAPNGVILTITVSWSDGEKRPRREAAMFRLLTLKEP